MPKIIGVRFRTSPRVYYFAPTDGETYAKDTKVIVETQRGVELATVVLPETDVDESKIVAPLKPVLRIATRDDLDAATADDEKKREILAIAKSKVAARELDMKIVDCEFTVDRSKLVLYFTAEQRVDFRELVRDLASAFRMRIDLRQIGARDECKLIGSLGCCGLPCCCGRFESDSEHVSIKMAKNQNLALTPNKINGMCGRLLCCLSYENKTYEEIMRRMPKHNAKVKCPDGRTGTVVSCTPLTEKVRVRVGDDDNFEFIEYTLAELNGEKPDGDGEKPNAEHVEQTEPQRENRERPPRRDGNDRNANKRNGGARNAKQPRPNENGGNVDKKPQEKQEKQGNKKNKKKFNKNKRPKNNGENKQPIGNGGNNNTTE